MTEAKRDEIINQMSDQMSQLVSAMATVAVGKRLLVPKAAYVTGPATFEIPAEVKSFNIINLGLSGAGASWSDIAITGLDSIAVLKAPVKVFGYSIENDNNMIKGNIIVQPAAGHIALIQYLV